MSMSIIILISILISICIHLHYHFSLVVKHEDGEKPELIISVLKLSIVYERYGWQSGSQISTTKGAN